MAGNDFIWRFTPSRTEPQVLEEIFVQREPLLANIVEGVRESATTRNKHQTLLIGPRGIGKTHLIALLHHRVTQDQALSETVRIAWLLEDETITSFVQLLKRVYELLAEEYPAEFPRDWLEDLLDGSPAKILKALETTLVRKFRDKTLLLFVENLNQIFDGLGDAGQKQWRAFLQTHPFTSVVATSQRLFKSVKNREQPFFGFFAPIHLHPLPAHDAVDLLSRIARNREQAELIAFLATPEGRSRVRALHHLAGGNHRIYIVLSGFITRESLDELAGPFEKMADELTPYYQERMRWLTLQQRQIVEYLCAREEPCTPKEIARHLLAAENTVSSQLKKLLELGYLLRNPRGRESLYELSEPLMRLASEVKEKRRKPLRLLVNFLRIWYRPDVLPQLLAKAGTPSLRTLLQAAIFQSQSTPDPRLKLLDVEIAKAKQENRLDDLLVVLEERAHTRGSARDWFETAFYHAKLRHFEASVECYDKALEIDPRQTEAWIDRGDSLRELEHFEAAVESYDNALEIDPRHAGAWNNKGGSLYKLGQYDSASGCYDKALEIDPQYTIALVNKGFLLSKLGEYDSASECLERAVRINPQDAKACELRDRLKEVRRSKNEARLLENMLHLAESTLHLAENKMHTVENEMYAQVARECLERLSNLDKADPKRIFGRTECLLALRDWEAGFASLREALQRRTEDATHDVKALINPILRLSEGREELRRHLAKLISIYHEAGALAFLGDGLVRSLSQIDVRPLGPDALKARNDAFLELRGSHVDLESPLGIFRVGIDLKTLEAWLDAWLELGGGLAELEIPLRIFRVGIEFLIQGDEKVLLDLVIIERSILRQALGLAAAEGAG